MKNDMSFAQVLHYLVAKSGKKFSREGWNGKDLFICGQYPDENSKMTVPYIYMNIPTGSKNVDGLIYGRSPWIPSMTDMFANDWKEVA